MAELIVEVWVEHLKPILGWLWGSAVFWRSVALASLTCLWVLYTQRKRLAARVLGVKSLDHDIDIFARSDNAMSEVSLSSLLDSLSTSDAYRSSQRHPLMDFIDFFRQAGNQYLDSHLRRSTAALTAALSDLLTFLAHHFFVYPRDQGGETDLQLCLYPELNIDRAGSGERDEVVRYHDFQKGLDVCIKRVSAAYRGYRAEVKRRLRR